MRIALILSVLAGVAAQAPAQVPPKCQFTVPSTPRVVRSNKALVRRFHDAINHQNWGVADSMVSSNYRHYVTVADGFKAIDWAAFKRGNQHLRSAFPDWKNNIVETIAENDKVAVMIEGHGTHQGSISGEKASGRKATLPIMTVHQICRGKLIADWEFVDVGPLMASLKD